MGLLVYAISLLLFAWLGVSIAGGIAPDTSTTIRILLGVLVLDGTKAPATAASGWLCGLLLKHDHPWGYGAALVLVAVALEAMVGTVLGQAEALVASVWVVMSRLATVSALVVLASWAIRQGMRRQTPPST